MMSRTENNRKRERHISDTFGNDIIDYDKKTNVILNTEKWDSVDDPAKKNIYNNRYLKYQQKIIKMNDIELDNFILELTVKIINLFNKYLDNNTYYEPNDIYIFIIILLFSNMYINNDPYLLLEKKIDEFQRRNEITKYACKLKLNSFQICDVSDINQFNKQSYSCNDNININSSFKEYDVEKFENLVSDEFIQNLKIAHDIINFDRKNDDHNILSYMYGWPQVIIIDYENFMHQKYDFAEKIKLLQEKINYLKQLNNDTLVIVVSKQNINIEIQSMVNYYITTSNPKYNNIYELKEYKKKYINTNQNTCKNDIDDMIIILLYMHCLRMNQKCVIITNDGFDYLSFPFLRLNSDNNPNKIKIIYQTTLSNLIKTINNKFDFKNIISDCLNPKKPLIISYQRYENEIPIAETNEKYFSPINISISKFIIYLESIANKTLIYP
jgi:hypothetical protein